MKRSGKHLVAVLIASAAVGAFSPAPQSNSAWTAVGWIVASLAFSINLYAWCKADIVERDLPYPAGIPVLVGHLFPIGVPLYFIITRTAGRALLSIVAALGFAALCFLLVAVGTYANAVARGG